MGVAALNKADAIVLLVGVDEAVGVALVDYRICGIGKLLSDSLLGLSDLGKLAASDDNTVFVNYTIVRPITSFIW